MSKGFKLPVEFSFEEDENRKGTPFIRCELRAKQAKFKDEITFKTLKSMISNIGGKVVAYSSRTSEEPRHISFLVAHEGIAFRILNTVKNAVDVVNYDDIKQPLSDLRLRDNYKKPNPDITHKTRDDAKDKGPDKSDNGIQGTLFA